MQAPGQVGVAGHVQAPGRTTARGLGEERQQAEQAEGKQAHG